MAYMLSKQPATKRVSDPLQLSRFRSDGFKRTVHRDIRVETSIYIASIIAKNTKDCNFSQSQRFWPLERYKSLTEISE
jgi:hypothetical protein